MTKTDIIIAYCWTHNITVVDVPIYSLNYSDLKGVPVLRK